MRMQLKSYFIQYFLVAVCLIWMSITATVYATTPAQEPAVNPVVKPEISAPIQAKIGIFVQDLHSLDLRNQSYSAVFWMWVIHPVSTHYKPENSTELVNAYTSEKIHTDSLIRSNNRIWSSNKFASKMAHQWDISHFPFDKQVLEIILEDSYDNYKKLQYVVDTENSKVSPNIHLQDWQVIAFDVKANATVHPSNFGDPELEDGTSTYARAVFSISLERKNTLKLFFNVFLTLYVAFILSALAFLISPENASARLSLATAAIFAAIGNKYAVDAVLPLTSYITLIDKVQILTFIFISISALITVIFSYLGENHKKIMMPINKIGGISFFISYVILNSYWIHHATQ